MAGVQPCDVSCGRVDRDELVAPARATPGAVAVDREDPELADPGPGRAFPKYRTRATDRQQPGDVGDPGVVQQLPSWSMPGCHPGLGALSMASISRSVPAQPTENSHRRPLTPPPVADHPTAGDRRPCLATDRSLVRWHVTHSPRGGPRGCRRRSAGGHVGLGRRWCRRADRRRTGPVSALDVRLGLPRGHPRQAAAAWDACPGHRPDPPARPRSTYEGRSACRPHVRTFRQALCSAMPCSP